MDKESSTMCVKLTEEQQKFLESLEEEFKDRYTEKDKEFKAVFEKEHPEPPLVANWREFRQPDERYGNDRNDYRGGRYGNRNRLGYDRRRYFHNDNDYTYSRLSCYVHRYRP